MVKEGDRIEVVRTTCSGGDYDAGDQAIVSEIKPRGGISVKWLKRKYRDEKREQNRMSYLYPEEFRVVHPIESTYSLPAAITEYHDACVAFEAAQLAVDKAKARIEDARLALKKALG